MHRLARLIEELEDARRRLGVEPGAVIAYRQARHVAHLGEPQLDRSVARRMVDGVADEVVHHLLEPRAIAAHPDARSAVIDAASRRPAGARQHVEGALHDHIEIERLQIERHLAADRAADIEEIVEQPLEMQRLALDHVARVLPVRTLRLGAVEQEDGVEDRRERIAQLVAEHCQEFISRATLALCCGERRLDAQPARRRPCIHDQHEQRAHPQ